MTHKTNAFLVVALQCSVNMSFSCISTILIQCQCSQSLCSIQVISIMPHFDHMGNDYIETTT